MFWQKYEKNIENKKGQPQINGVALVSLYLQEIRLLIIFCP